MDKMFSCENSNDDGVGPQMDIEYRLRDVEKRVNELQRILNELKVQISNSPKAWNKEIQKHWST